MRFSHTLSTCKHYVSVSIIVLAMTLFLAGCPSPNDPAPNDSKPLLTITTPTRASVTEGDTSTFTITRDNVEGALEVSLTLSGMAEHNVDYTVDPTVNTDSSTGDKTMTVVFEDRNKSVDITVTAVNDEVPDTGEEVVIKISESSDYTIGNPSTVTLTIVDPSVVRISTNGEINEGERIIVTISSEEQVPNDLAVSLTIRGDATINADYTTSLDAIPQSDIQTATVTIPGESNEVTFTIDAIDDGFDDIDESLIITIDPSHDYELAAGNNGSHTVTITIKNDSDVDDDNNGLIEIHNLDMLRNVHFNLAGTSYDDEEDDVSGNGATGSTNGAPPSPTDHCKTLVDGDVYICGYELTRDLDFTDAGSYATGMIKEAWRPDGEGNSNNATNEGFPGIGAETGNIGGFTGIFEGNGYSISNLYMRNTTTLNYNTGLFRLTSSGAKIRNLGMTNVAIYGGAGNYDNLGGLVGNNRGGIITASYATGTVDGGDGNYDNLGGLVGNNHSIITASYATGTVDGGDGNTDFVGGLVGLNYGAITASYATGTVDGGDGNDAVGGLVGNNHNIITASYATGDIDGGDGNDRAGGLVGNSAGTITASYATGTVDGGDGDSDRVGGLMGSNNGTIIASYGFGTPSGEIVNSDDTPKPNNVTEAFDLTKDNAGTEWNNADSNTLDAWYFGTSSQNPALKYADYDGPGTTYSCDQFQETIPGTDYPLVWCGTTLLPGQRD